MRKVIIDNHELLFIYGKYLEINLPLTGHVAKPILFDAANICVGRYRPSSEDGEEFMRNKISGNQRNNKRR